MAIPEKSGKGLSMVVVRAKGSLVSVLRQVASPESLDKARKF